MRYAQAVSWVLGLALPALATAHAVSTPPALANAGFEADAAAVVAPLEWESRGDTAADFTEAGGHSGGYRLTHAHTGDFSVETRQVFRVRPGSVFTVRGWVRRSTGSNDSRIELRCGGRAERVHVPAARADQWLQVVVSSRAQGRNCTVSLRTIAAGGEWTHFDDLQTEAGEPRLSILGSDISSLKKSEDLGGVYIDPGRRGTRHDGRDHRGRRASAAMDIMADHGLNFARFRVWLDPADGYHDPAELLQMARRAQRAGLDVLVNLHYSDTWADPAHQSKPAAWEGLDFQQLKQAVHDHTASVCRSLRAQGTPPAMIQLGNELNSGMLWPDGHTWNPPNWDNLAALLKAGVDAVRSGCGRRTRIMLHLADGGDNGLYRWWFDNITSRGVDFDLIGFSYYGFWHGSLGDLQANLNDISARYGKDVVVAETAYPFTLADADSWENIINLPEELVPGYAATPEGQAANQRDVLAIVRAVPNGRGLGAFYWDGTWTGVRGNGWDPADPSSGNAWENQALFDFEGRPVPAMDVYRP